MPKRRPKKRPKLRSSNELTANYELQRIFEADDFDGAAVIRIVQKNPSVAETKLLSSIGEHFPFHTVLLRAGICRDVSFDIIETIYRAFPQAAREKDQKFDRTPLHIALSLGMSLDVIRLILEGWPHAVAEKDKNGWTPLHYAAAKKLPVNVFSFMVERCPEAAVEKEPKYGETPLHFVCKNGGPLELATTLLEKNPLLAKEKTTVGLTPLHYACLMDVPLELVSLLLDKHPTGSVEKAINGTTPLHVACRYGKNLNLMRLLLERHPKSAIEKDIKGRTALLTWMEVGRSRCTRSQFKEGRIVIEGIADLVEHNVDQLRASHIFIEFAAMEWWRGAMLVFDLFPPARKKLDKFHLKMFPGILSAMGRHCHLTTIW
eukprot:CAMPEP_0185725300 /NCGR_PEP_ID=MMETSP1171-20130828/1594_1 /TAXON_ID=374046 /ORGANISM="Helicotheca tamensis, Strain CCMP826" /LENGTH=374 /DNA_ID=CAMNT_0028393391 /DNA_START=41 /DNA_END=1162 /DNA_ORIENTATION=+